MGLVGWRRERKGAALAAQPKHLLGFRRDRREAVILFWREGKNTKNETAVAGALAVSRSDKGHGLGGRGSLIVLLV